MRAPSSHKDFAKPDGKTGTEMRVAVIAVASNGPEGERLKKLAGPNVKFVRARCAK